MRKHSFIAILCVVVMLGTVMLYRDKQTLFKGVIRLHVVADSDAAEDQRIKLQVRDAVLHCLQERMKAVTTADAAKICLKDNLAAIEAAANTTLQAAGSTDVAKVTFCREAFPVREYDTFMLPSGVYESLRVTIGSGEGKNWWCVVFPSFCIGTGKSDFRAAAVSAGFTDTLTGSMAGEREYRLSFFLLDCIGRLENFFHLQ